MNFINLPGLILKQNEPLSKHTTFAIGGPADFYAEVENVEALAHVLRRAQEQNQPIFFLGAGSNLLVSDKGIRGWTIRLTGEFEKFSLQGSKVKTGAGVMLPILVKHCAARGLGGGEPLVGVPGTVGGALVMNAGTREAEIGSFVKSVEILNIDGKTQILERPQIHFEYRKSSLLGACVVGAELEFIAKPAAQAQAEIEKYISFRLRTQPIGTLNVGSIFKNPPGKFSAQLIEACGLKGFQIGQAQISPKHANYIVNLGGATAVEVAALIIHAQKIVREKFAVELEPEVKRVGDWSAA